MLQLKISNKIYNIKRYEDTVVNHSDYRFLLLISLDVSLSSFNDIIAVFDTSTEFTIMDGDIIIASYPTENIIVSRSYDQNIVDGYLMQIRLQYDLS